MIKSIGIDKISFYIPKYFTKVENFGADINLCKKVGQIENSIADDDENIITMGISAASNILKDYSDKEINNIDYLIFATESSFDLSKSAGFFCKKELNLPSHCNIFEIKQACHAGTSGLIFAMNYINSFPDKKILIITSDISKYEKPNAQITQGAGACAFVISLNPKIIEFENNFVSYSADISDFYKPISNKYPIVNGSLSVETYCDFFQKTFKSFLEKIVEKNLQEINISKKIEDIILIPHLPFVNIFNLIEKVNTRLLKEILKENNLEIDKIENTFLYQDCITKYTSLIGNSYTACMYINLCSLLENCNENLSNREIYMFSFGSGAIATAFKGKIISGYEKFVKKDIHKSLFLKRQEILNPLQNDTI